MGTSADQDDNRAPDSAGYDEFHALFLDEQDQPFDDPKDTPYFRFTIFRTADDPSDPPVEENFDAKIDDQDPNNDDKSVYLTSEIIDRAIDWINAREENNETYFAYIPFFAPHGPFHCPLEGADTPYPNETFECTQNPGNDESFRSMIHTIDFEIERLLDETSTDPLVIIVSDNGTPSSLTTDPWDSNKAKGTVGQGGVLVPFIAFGDTVQLDQEIDQSVSVNDLYATILDFAGKHSLLPSPTDSKSLKGLLEGGSSAPHVYNYTETFFPNFEPGSGFGPCRGQQAVQEDPGEYVTDTYKYIRRVDGQEALYELDGDFDETDNLINSVPDANRLQDLKDHIDQSLDSDLASICDGKLDTGESCTDDSDCCSNMCSNTIMTCVCPL